MAIYLDHNATSPVDPEHLEQVFKTVLEMDGNPSSAHEPGRKAKVILEQSRRAISKIFSSHTSEIIFTSGATESNNFIVQGFLKKYVTTKIKPHILYTAIEHPSMLEPIAQGVRLGFCTASEVSVSQEGFVDDSVLESHLTKCQLTQTPLLVCIIHANNEVGTIQNLERLSAKIKSLVPTAHVHSDMVQSFGKTNLAWVASSAVDSASVSGHKIGGFKGVGALYLKQKAASIDALIVGGSQERNRRSGTENIPGIISFGYRAKEILDGKIDFAATRSLRAWLVSELEKLGAKVHGPQDANDINEAGVLSQTVHFHFDGISGPDLLILLDLEHIFLSSGSACSTGVGRPSHVVKALGYDDFVALNSLRLSFGPKTRREELVTFIHSLKTHLSRITNSIK